MRRFWPLILLILFFATKANATFYLEVSYDAKGEPERMVTHYEVFMNGEPLCTANPSPDPSFTHDCEPQDVAPGTYDFTVRGVTVGGDFTPTSAPYSYRVLPGMDTPIIIRIRN